jgi:hypothetical protein
LSAGPARPSRRWLRSRAVGYATAASRCLTALINNGSSDAGLAALK